MEAALPPSATSLNPSSDVVETKSVSHMFSTSVIGATGALVTIWPLDVLKTHILAGKNTGMRHVFSKCGLLLGLGECTLLGLDISAQYIEREKNISTSKKVLFSLIPCALLPALSCLNFLKINAQVRQQDIYSTFTNVTKDAGYRALTRGMGLYSAMVAVSMTTMVIPVCMGSDSRYTPVLLGCGFFANLLLNTPLEVLKTRAMLNMPSGVLDKGILYKSLEIRFAHFVGFFIAQGIFFSLSDYYLRTKQKVQKEMEKVRRTQDKYKTPTEFDGFIPEDTADLNLDQILDLCETKNG